METLAIFSSVQVSELKKNMDDAAVPPLEKDGGACSSSVKEKEKMTQEEAASSSSASIPEEQQGFTSASQVYSVSYVHFVLTKFHVIDPCILLACFGKSRLLFCCYINSYWQWTVARHSMPLFAMCAKPQTLLDAKIVIVVMQQN